MEMKIYGIAEQAADTALYCCGYILVDSAITYLDYGMAEGESLPTTVTYNSVASNVTQPTSIDAVVPTKQEDIA